MDKIKTGVQTILDKQKVSMNKIEEQKVLLLGTGNTDEYSDIKQAIGWDDTDREIERQLSKNIEINHVINENKDTSILTEEAMYDYCIDNNYVLINLGSYKGKIENNTLEILSKYCKDNNIKLGSEADLKTLFILCRFCDIKGNNNTLNKSKRYTKGELPKIILLHRIDKLNKYNENYYKVITEQGVETPVINFKNSLYKTHTKTTNFFRNFLGLTILFIIIGLLMSLDENIVFSGGLTLLYSIIVSLMILKTIVPCIMEYAGEYPSFNLFYDNFYRSFYKKESYNDYLTSVLDVNFHSFSSKFKKSKIILKNQLFYWIMIGLFSIFSLVFIHSTKLIKISKTGYVTIPVETNYNETKYSKKLNKIIYSHRTGVFDVYKRKKGSIFITKKRVSITN